MPDPELTEEQLNALSQTVEANLPDGDDKERLKALVDAARERIAQSYTPRGDSGTTTTTTTTTSTTTTTTTTTKHSVHP
jgi:hypothetical protein